MGGLSVILRISCAFILWLCLDLPEASATNPPINIATEPLFSGQGNVHPNMVLSLSIEYPAVGAAYRSTSDVYDKTVEYVGYFNPLKCYGYNGGNRNLTDEGYFYIVRNADVATHECGGETFSGNFMNWAVSSTLDMMRYALTGGDRIIDTATTTVLQRAVLRDASSDNFYAHKMYFPRRVVTADGNSSAPNRVTPFNTKTLYVVSCRNRILFSDISSGLMGDNPDDSKEASRFCTSAYDGKGKPTREALDKRLGEYLARVKVCDRKEATTRSDLCQKYGSSYKPVGEIQRRSDRVRLAAMGYLLDDSPRRYGGVLRTPMKYVGPIKIDTPKFSEGENDYREWDPVTGVLYNNPDNPSARDSPAMNSGVINYLNKFGRSGNYKTYDPLSELYYEAIRYLQGRQRTPDATSGMTEPMRDGFPVITTWTDPVSVSCQRNYVVSVADANTHWDRYVPGNERTRYGEGSDAFDVARPIDLAVAGRTPEFDVKTWTRTVGDMEAAANSVGGQRRALLGNLDNLQSQDTGAAGEGTYYMAGLAYWAHTNDIRLDKHSRVTTFSIDLDEGGNGLVDGSTRIPAPRESQLYLAAKYGGSADRERVANPFISDEVNDGALSPLKRLRQSGKQDAIPSNYFLGSRPRDLIQAIRKVFARVGAPSSGLSGAALSGTHFAADESHLYRSGFDASTWSGSLRRIALELDAKGALKTETAADWDAGEILTGVDEKSAFPAPGARKIYTTTANADRSTTTVEFQWDQLSSAQKASLDISPTENTRDGLGEQRVQYLRGQRTLEIGHPAGIFRARERILGDIINSNSVYVGAPAVRATSAAYRQFFSTYRDRVKAVYVGANDGMLHAFSATDGTELFAYVPNALLKKLNQLTHPAYVHQPYVDGQLAVGEALAGGQWKTILASGMGGGTQGIFALDVTDPSDFGGGAGALWEFTDADDDDMGNVLGAPQIVQLMTRIVRGVPEYKYFVAVSSGMNNYVDDGGRRFNTDGAGALFLLSLDKSPAVKWQLGVNYFKFRTPSRDATLPNGLSAPALVIGSDGAVRYAYAGDLQGNLWRFDFTGMAPWSNALGPRNPLFVATDQSGNRQPITVQPKVVFAPGGGYVVLFGTGKLVEDRDIVPAQFRQQSFYGIYDTTDAQYTVQGRGQLAARSLERADGDVLRITGSPFIYGTMEGQKRGWYVDFLDAAATGERSVTPALISAGKILFNTVLPGAVVCAAGSGRSYMFSALTGLPPAGNATGYVSHIGMLGPPIKLETSTDISDRNATGGRTARKKFTIINVGTGGVQGNIAPAEQLSGEWTMPAGRFSWREISNWQELHNASRR